MQTQYDRIGRLLTRKCGATPFELMEASRSTSVHSRLSEMKRQGWRIVRKPIPGRSYGTYHGTKPKAGRD